MNVLTTLVISIISAVMITICIDMVEKLLKEGTRQSNSEA